MADITFVQEYIGLYLSIALIKLRQDRGISMTTFMEIKIETDDLTQASWENIHVQFFIFCYVLLFAIYGVNLTHRLQHSQR